MKQRRFSLLVVLSLLLALSAMLIFTSPVSAHAASVHHNNALLPNIASCGFNGGNYDVDVDSQTSGNHYFCGTGYTGMYVTGVFNVYNNSPWTVWIRWYQGGPGQFCYITPQWEAQWGGSQVLVTQLDINAQQGGPCPAF